MCSEGPLEHPQGTEGHGQRPLPNAQDSGQRAPWCTLRHTGPWSKTLPQSPRIPRAVVRGPPDARLGHTGLWTYLAPSLIVVAVHRRAGVRPILSRVREFPRHHPTKLDVLAAATPFPAVAWRALVTAAASADGSGALGAGACHCEGHSGGGNGVHEGGLPGGCGERREVGRAQGRAGLRGEGACPQRTQGRGRVSPGKAHQGRRNPRSDAKGTGCGEV